MQVSKDIQKREFLNYKFLNSLFTGLSLGSLFTIYAPLSPSTFSIGGIVLAIGLLLVAKIYTKILNIKTFFYISFFVEVLLIFAIVYFLINSYDILTSLFVYASYQVTFIFGSFLVRAETVFLSRTKILSFLDVAKQKGYLVGLAFSYIFYEVLKFYGVADNRSQVYYLHFILLPLQVFVVYYVYKAFRLRP
jgi:hypothetical protein